MFGMIILAALSLAVVSTSGNAVLPPGEIQCDFMGDGSTAMENHPSDNVLANISVHTDSALLDNLGLDNQTMTCTEGNPKPYCYALWQVDPRNSNKKLFFKKGCYTWNGECSRTCVSRQAHSSIQLYFCCCQGNMCNVNVTDPVNETHTVTSIAPAIEMVMDKSYTQRTIIIAVGSVVAVSFFIAIIFLIFRLNYRARRAPVEALSLLESAPVHNVDLAELKLGSQLYRGRYAEVWHGALGDIGEVAVKTFSSSQKQHYLNERDIYSLPLMEHDNLLKFYGAQEEILVDGTVRYSIVVQFVPQGSLNNYLKNNTHDWRTLCKMCEGIAAGLAHLHMDTMKGELTKPAIAHRDFNSRNILVRTDLTCIVADLGFSMQIQGSKYLKNGVEESAEQASLTDVGTLRYMAPEVLDGAVNLRDCEASLKQIDVYALGLVLWELASRCVDLYQGLPMPEYKLPYQSEVGQHPTIEEMQVLVSRDKKRPAFPDVWKDSNQAIRALKETIEDCWDPDAEARLTAMCVQERIYDLEILWEARLKGLSPSAINPHMTHLEALRGRGLMSHENQTSSLPDNLPMRSTNHMLGVSTDDGQYRHSDIIHTTHVGHYSRLASPSESNTGETTVSSDNEHEAAPLLTKNDVNLRMEQENKHREPIPGRNQIVDRNTHKRSAEELAVRGNRLDGLTSQAKCDIHETAKDLFGTPNTSVSNIQPTTNESSPVQHAVATDNMNVYVRPANNPIPYLQNEVNSSGPVLPKQENIPGNGGTVYNMAPIETRPITEDKITSKNKLKLRLSKERFLRLLPSFMSKGEAQVHEAQHGRNPTDGAGVNHHVPTEVTVIDGTPVVRPTRLTPESHMNRLTPESHVTNVNRFTLDSHVTNVNRLTPESHVTNVNRLILESHVNRSTPSATDKDNVAGSSSEQAVPENRLGMAEVGVARMKQANYGSPTLVHRPKSDRTNDLIGQQARAPSNVQPIRGSVNQASVSIHERYEDDLNQQNGHLVSDDIN